MSSLAQLLRDLGSDSELAEAYKKDPEGVMKRAGLNDEEIKAMLARDVEAVKKLSGLEKIRANGTIQPYD